jgi:hypothetical protein
VGVEQLFDDGRLLTTNLAAVSRLRARASRAWRRQRTCSGPIARRHCSTMHVHPHAYAGPKVCAVGCLPAGAILTACVCASDTRGLQGLLTSADGTSFEAHEMGSSLQFTEGGSMMYKGFVISDKGVQTSPDGPAPASGITTADITFQEEIGRGASSTVYRALVPSSPVTAGKPSIVAVKVHETPNPKPQSPIPNPQILNPRR